MPVRSFLPIKRRNLLGLVLISIITISCVAFSMTGNDEFDFARREILLRRIGHEILLQSGDSVSRVLPVKKVSRNEYLISFENEFTFQPESLVNTTQRLLSRDPLANGYVVNVLNCTNASVVYGYAISKEKKDDIVACIGRRQPIACYKINIKFKSAGITTMKNEYLIGAILFLIFVGFLFLRLVKPRKASPLIEQPGMLTLGAISFDPEARKLMINGNSIDLTRTETRVLRIFALSPNEVIERSRLQKEIWEDEGVIVGRSLDVFISKLRKKLESDPNVKIIVIRSKGYKLEVSA
ncbi:MAG: winged helix-turn-helix transcriptional regulator [Bacteroidetes bacterium]|nr:winged helix-turn-helix transcriptional regulator [Bacteroidota bacterium]